MHKWFRILMIFILPLRLIAAGKDSTIRYELPDSIKAVQFLTEITVNELSLRKRIEIGIHSQPATITLSDDKGERQIWVSTHQHSKQLAMGEQVTTRKYGGINFPYRWQNKVTYKFLISMASDSAAQLTIYSAYVFLPESKKWKLIASRRHPFYTDRLRDLSVSISSDKKTTSDIIIGDTWIQRSSGSWKNLKNSGTPSPVINFFGHVDSVYQRQKDVKQIEDSIAAGKTDAINNVQAVYYSILKEGTGRQVSVGDTVVAYYKGYLFSDGTVFDQTKEQPATFPLKRLIRGWQIGLPLLKVGGKIKLIIPSDLAYSIRTRAAKIPPNSILVFEVEVVDVKGSDSH